MYGRVIFTRDKKKRYYHLNTSRNLLKEIEIAKKFEFSQNSFQNFECSV